MELKKKTKCSLCNNIIEYDNFSYSLIPITKNDFLYNNINEKIISFKLTTFGSCEICMHKNQNIYTSFLNNCKTIFILDFKLPKFLIFNLELSDQGEDGNLQYKNIINLKNNYKHLFPTYFIYDNLTYNLKGTINQYSINHYNSLIIRNKNTRYNFELNKSYLYDRLNTNNNIKEVKISSNYNIDEILVYKPKIFIYSYLD